MAPSKTGGELIEMAGPFSKAGVIFNTFSKEKGRCAVIPIRAASPGPRIEIRGTPTCHQTWRLETRLRCQGVFNETSWAYTDCYLETVMEMPVTSALAIFDQAVFGVAQASPAGDWQFLNDRFREIVGHSRQELLASSERDITDPDDRAESDGSDAGSWRMRFRLLIGEPLCPRRMEPSCGPNCVSL